MSSRFPSEEYQRRIARLQQALQAKALDAAVIFDDVNQFYLAGSSQNGALVIPADGLPRFFVRRSLERAQIESWLADADTLYPMKGFKELPATLKNLGIGTQRLGIVKGSVLADHLERFQRGGFEASEFIDITAVMKTLRAVKSPAEIALQAEAGRRQSLIFAAIPDMLHVGMTEWALGMEIRRLMLLHEDPGFSRFSAGNRIPSAGYFCFGASAVYPTPFDGPGGIVGLNLAMPVSGSSGKRLERHMPVYIDFVLSCQGYFTDMTRIFSIGDLPDNLMQAQADCLTIQSAIIERLKPGAIPSAIYAEVNALVDDMGIQEGFMGAGDNKVKFFGHGAGLVVDDYPVLAKGFDAPLEPGMVLAIEPKRGFAGVGMMGIENTWQMTPDRARSLTRGPETVVNVSGNGAQPLPSAGTA